MDKTFRISNNLRDFNLVFSLEVDPKNSDDYSFYIDIEQLSEGRKVIIPHIIRKDGSAFNLKNFSLRITIPLLDIHGISMPGKYDNPYLSRIPWNFNKKTSSHQNFPFLSFINREGMNKLALGVKNPALGYHVIGKLDEGNECEIKLEIKTIGNILGKSFQPQIFFSWERASWFEVTKIYSEWTETEREYIPSYAYEPVFCTWYAVHQELHQNWLEKTALEAYKLGYKTLIVDDGWFTSDTGRGYWYTGDWEACNDVFEDFEAHVRRVQDIGMKYILWIAPFMVGKYSKAYKRFEDLLVAPMESFANLCPQSKSTLEYILEVITKLYKKYHLNGFKFDFIDSLPVEPCTESNHEHFCETPGEGVEKILQEIKERLSNLGNNTSLIEFRQRYATPIMRRYSTAFRALDAPLDFDTNRRRIINLRSFTGRFPVYSDPIYWHKGEFLSNIALHFISCIFSVPMLSVDLLEISEDEKKIISFWTNFSRENREILLLGKLIPIFAGGDFSGVCSIHNRRRILAFYNNNSYYIEKELLSKNLKELFILNGSNREGINLYGEELTGNWLIEVKDLKGYTVKKFERTLNGFLSMPVKIGGLIYLLRE